MQHEIIWQQIEGVGLEHLLLSADAAAILADGMLLAMEDGKPLRAHYTIECDADWQVRQVELSVAGGTSQPPRFLALRARGDGHWESRIGSCDNLQANEWASRPDLDGCVDIDIYPSPFTNTLPIRRLRLTPGDAAQISVAFIKLPELTVQSVQQRYTHLHALNSLDAVKDAGELSDDGARYRYEGLDSGYVADLPVDAEGLVIEYPGWFRRVYP